MSKESTRPQEVKTVWWKTAKLPWALIIIVVVLSIGFVAGWVARSNDAGRVVNEARVMAKQMAPAQSKDQQ